MERELRVTFSGFVLLKSFLLLTYLAFLILFIYYMLEPNGWLSSISPIGAPILTQELTGPALVGLIVSVIFFFFVLFATYRISSKRMI